MTGRTAELQLEEVDFQLMQMSVTVGNERRRKEQQA